MSRATRKRKSLLFWSNNGTGLAHNWTSMLFLLHLSSSSLTQAWGYDLFREKMAECLTEHWLTKAPNNGHNIFTVPACMQISKGGNLRNSPKLFVWPDYRMYVGRVVEGGALLPKSPQIPPLTPPPYSQTPLRPLSPLETVALVCTIMLGNLSKPK